MHGGKYIFVGEWVNGKRKGRVKCVDGEYIYMGYWEDDQRHGWGI